MGKFRLWSGPTNVRSYPEAASETFKEGDPVFFSSGSVTIATDGDDIVGIAAMDATGTTGSDIRVHEITPEQIWSIHSSGATPAKATHVGNDYDFSVSTTATTLALGSAGTDAIIVNLDPRDTPASGSRVLVRFHPDSCWNWNAS